MTYARGVLFTEPVSSDLTASRIKARQKRRLTYDCMNARVKGDRVICRDGYLFPQIGCGKGGEYIGLDLVGVLAGRSSSVCQGCEDYDGEVTE